MSYDPASKRLPIVTDIDRDWAVAQKPVTWDDDAPDLDWADHVAEQAERFEAHFATDRKPAAEWSGLWRRVWWPKADPSILNPKTAPKQPPHPFVKRGEEAWLPALAAATAKERALAMRLGVIVYRRDDPRAVIITGEPPARISGTIGAQSTTAKRPPPPRSQPTGEGA